MPFHRSFPRHTGPRTTEQEITQIWAAIEELKRALNILLGHYEIKISADDETSDTNQQFIFEVPSSLDGWSLQEVRAYVTTPGSDDIEISMTNLNGAVNLLSTNITIDAGEYSSLTAATPPVIFDPPYNIVAEGDQIQSNVDVASIDALGLGVMLQFA